jgi:hypothetical protein
MVGLTNRRKDVVKHNPVPNREELYRVVKSRVPHDLRIVGDYALQPTFFTELPKTAEGAGSALADELWKADEPRPKGSALHSRLREHMSEDIDSRLMDEMWGTLGLGDRAAESFNRTLTELEKDSDDQFAVLWRSRVVDKVRLHAQALTQLADEALRAQLEEALQSYVAGELIPSTITRARSKGLLRGSRLKSRVAKLQTAVEKGPRDALSELEKLNTQLEIQAYSKGDLINRRDAYLKDMVALMMKDGDAARLFIRLIIVLLAREGEGALYATGKFAPKLLKVLKSHVEEADAVWLEQVKSSIKTGTVSDEMREDMREKAAASILA